jgi:rare lipoprotein A
MTGRLPGPLLLALCLSACFGPTREDDGFPEVIPADLDAIPDAVPVALPKSRYGNPKDYEVLGERYFVLNSAAGYKERGHASWYGTKFHGKRTSSGEPYDMFAMTAAHKTLPLPTYVRVTHLGNGKSVVVKVNDRGPFHVGRIIDLSYAAAARLDILGQGSAMVEVETVTPGAPAVEAAAPAFLEVGATSDPIQAVALREEVVGLGIVAVEIRSEERDDEVWHRVLVGPFRDSAGFEAARRRLEAEQHSVKPVQE